MFFLCAFFLCSEEGGRLIVFLCFQVLLCFFGVGFGIWGCRVSIWPFKRASGGYKVCRVSDAYPPPPPPCAILHLRAKRNILHRLPDSRPANVPAIGG